MGAGKVWPWQASSTAKCCQQCVSKSEVLTPMLLFICKFCCRQSRWQALCKVEWLTPVVPLCLLLAVLIPNIPQVAHKRHKYPTNQLVRPELCFVHLQEPQQGGKVCDCCNSSAIVCNLHQFGVSPLQPGPYLLIVHGYITRDQQAP